MTNSHWFLILVLAVAAFAIRVTGLLAGNRIKASRHVWMLDDLPGLIIVSLIAASLAGEPLHMWMAAAVALGVAIATNHVIATMCIGVAAFVGLSLILG